jgi:hypothetical protein
MYIYGQIRKAQLENSTSDPTKRGEILFRTDQTKFKFYDGSAVRVVVTEDSTQTLTNKTLSGNTAVTLISGSGTMALNTSGTVTLPNATDTLVGKATTDTLTNKTIDGDDNTVQDLALTALKTVLADASKFIVRDASGIPVSNTKAVPSGVVVGDTDSQTLSNKTLTSPTINTPTMSGPYVNDYIELDEEASAPSTPSAGRKRIYAKNDGLVYTKDSAGSETPIGSGGGGGNLVISEIANAPVKQFLANMPVYSFGAGLDQSLYVTVNIPSTYVAGKPVKLKIKAFSEDTSGNFLISANAILIRSETDDYDSTTNAHASTNSAITMSASNDKEIQKITLDISSATGTVNSVAIAAGDVLIVRIYRNTDTATGDVQYVMGAEEVTLT